MAFDGVSPAPLAPPPPPLEVMRSAQAHYAQHTGLPAALDGVPELAELAARYPGSERLNLLAVRLVDRGLGRAEAIPAWRKLADRFPHCDDAVAVLLRWTRQTKGVHAAREEVRRRARSRGRSAEALLQQARSWAAIHEVPRAKRCFAALLRTYPECEQGYLRYAQFLRRLDPARAVAVLDAGLARIGTRPNLAALRAEIGADLSVLHPVLGRGGRSSVGGHVLRHLIMEAGRGRASPTGAPGRLGKVVMLGATLGAGGAERQLVNTAVGLDASDAAGEVEVWCRSVTDRPGADFFLPALAQRGIRVRLYAEFPRCEGALGLSPEASGLLRFLPADVLEATLRLTGELCRSRPCVVHLWQDGTILACALAAVLAGVPRIVLSVRTAPPPDRPERDKPEYLPLYRALLRLPGVTLVANSQFAARRYSAWIGLPGNLAQTVYNGLQPLSRAAGRRTRAVARSMRPARFTLGAVMRLDENKRPRQWIDCAARLCDARLCAEMPEIRFVIVGDGPLYDDVADYVRLRGLQDRVLLVGRTNEVGFWLGQMDALLLLSRCEGLPNVLIEAQSLGVPVITTPAGGAAETLIDGETGYVLGSAEAPCLDEAMRRLRELAADADLRRSMSARARRFARASFSLQKMISRTIETYGV